MHSLKSELRDHLEDGLVVDGLELPLGLLTFEHSLTHLLHLVFRYVTDVFIVHLQVVLVLLRIDILTGELAQVLWVEELLGDLQHSIEVMEEALRPRPIPLLDIQPVDHSHSREPIHYELFEKGAVEDRVILLVDIDHP